MPRKRDLIQYTRICRNCGKLLNYSCYQSWYKSEKNNSLCKKCTLEKKWIHNPILPILKKYYEEGLNDKEIEIKMNMSRNSVAYYLRKLGLESNWDKKHPHIQMVDENNARCVKCHEIKPILEFQWGRQGTNGAYKFSYCNTCRRQQSHDNLNKSIEKFLNNKYNNLKCGRTKDGIAVTITKEEFIQIYYNQNGKCFYTDVIMTWKAGNGKNFKESLSVDKIVPAIGYVLGNVVFCTTRVNAAKSNFTLEEIQKWMPSWYKRIRKFQQSNGLL